MAQQIVLKGCWLRNGDVEFHGYQLNIYLSNVTPTLFCSILNSFWLTVQFVEMLQWLVLQFSIWIFPLKDSEHSRASTPILLHFDNNGYTALESLDFFLDALYQHFTKFLQWCVGNYICSLWKIVLSCIKCTQSIVLPLDYLNSLNPDLFICLPYLSVLAEFQSAA